MIRTKSNATNITLCNIACPQEDWLDQLGIEREWISSFDITESHPLGDFTKNVPKYDVRLPSGAKIVHLTPIAYPCLYAIDLPGCAYGYLLVCVEREEGHAWLSLYRNRAVEADMVPTNGWIELIGKVTLAIPEADKHFGIRYHPEVYVPSCFVLPEELHLLRKYCRNADARCHTMCGSNVITPRFSSDSSGCDIYAAYPDPMWISGGSLYVVVNRQKHVVALLLEKEYHKPEFITKDELNSQFSELLTLAAKDQGWL